tara:strand:+ start:63 stop:497 length:435 start_codon:yes stop_codon:yes gene_type:complete
MRRSASEIIRNLEMRIARLEKQSRRNEVEVDEHGELVDVDSVIELIDLEDVAYEILNDGDFEDMMEEQGEDIDDLSPRLLQHDLEVESTSAGSRSKDGEDHFFFFVTADEYDYAAIVSVDLEGEPSVDHVGEYNSAWRLFNRWT